MTRSSAAACSGPIPVGRRCASCRPVPVRRLAERNRRGSLVREYERKREQRAKGCQVLGEPLHHEGCSERHGHQKDEPQRIQSRGSRPRHQHRGGLNRHESGRNRTKKHHGANRESHPSIRRPGRSSSQEACRRGRSTGRRCRSLLVGHPHSLGHLYRCITSRAVAPATYSPPESIGLPRPAPSASRSASNKTTRQRNTSTSASVLNPSSRPTCTPDRRAW